jgi:hypothetical protein
MREEEWNDSVAISDLVDQALQRTMTYLRRGWCRRNLAENVAGQPVDELSPKASRWCLVGAVHAVCHELPAVEQVVLRVLQAGAMSMYQVPTLVELNERLVNADSVVGFVQRVREWYSNEARGRESGVVT